MGGHIYERGQFVLGRDESCRVYAFDRVGGAAVPRSEILLVVCPDEKHVRYVVRTCEEPTRRLVVDGRDLRLSLDQGDVCVVAP